MFGREKQVQRKKEFKKGIDADAARKKREEVQVSIRKEKRGDNVQKKRNVSTTKETKVVDSTIAQRVGISLSIAVDAFLFLSSKNYQN